jgi:hypothetical protein
VTTPPGYNASEIDTEAVVGETGAAPRGTQDRAADKDTTTTGSGAYGGGPTGLTQNPNTAISHTPDTEGIGTGANGPYVPNVNPLLSGTIDTETMGWPQTAGVTQAYRAPSMSVGYLTGERDTTRTDQPTSDGLGSTKVETQTKYTGTLFSANVGAFSPAMGTGVPVAPSAAPTVAAGPRSVTVTWSGVTDPSNAKVLGYVVLGSTGGTTYAGRNATSVVVNNLVPDIDYTFRVAARNVNGIGPASAASSTVQAYNPDESDAARPGGLNAYWAQNPIYGPNGTIKSGSGTSGIPGAPAAPTLASGGSAGRLTVTWTAPISGGTLQSYTVTLSTGQTVTGLSTSTLTRTFTGLTTGTATTARVTAVGSIGSSQSAASSSVNVP